MTIRKKSEMQFLQALQLCYSLTQHLGEPSILPCQAITLLCEIGNDPNLLLDYNRKYSLGIRQKKDRKLFPVPTKPFMIQKARRDIDKYARSADNWRVIGENCSLGFGVRDHCSILDFLLNFPSSDFKKFTGNFESAELICEFLQEWKGINLFPLLSKKSQFVNK